jgi:hypothetical protein
VPRLRTIGLAALTLIGCHFGSSAGSSGSVLGNSTTDAATTTDGGDDVATAGTITTMGPVATGTGGDTTGEADVDTTMGAEDSTSGAPLPDLVDEGLIARYFLDEGPAAMKPMFAIDSGPAPGVDLSLVRVGTQPTYVEPNPRHSGLQFDTVNVAGGAFATIDNKINDTLELDSKNATLEVVLEITNAGSGSDTSSVFWIGDNANLGDLALLASLDRGFIFAFNDQETFAWKPESFDGSHVLHVVVDTELGNPAERVEMFIDGVSTPSTGGNAPSEDASASFPNGGRIVIGNREDGDSSPQATIYYAAVYAGALTDEQIANNALVLSSDDDGP